MRLNRSHDPEALPFLRVLPMVYTILKELFIGASDSEGNQMESFLLTCIIAVEEAERYPTNYLQIRSQHSVWKVSASSATASKSLGTVTPCSWSSLSPNPRTVTAERFLKKLNQWIFFPLWPTGIPLGVVK